MNPRRRIAVFAPKAGAVSETFLRATLSRLPFDIVPLFGFPGQFTDQHGRRVWRVTSLLKLTDLLTGPVGISDEGFEDFLLARLIRRLKVEAVLAEYGPTGVMVLGACQRARIPLVVQFHGSDAFRRSVVEHYATRYRRLFAGVEGIVVKSGPMQRQLVALGAPSEKILTSPACVDPSQFGEAFPGSAPPHFLAVGRFVEKKAPHLTVLAFRTAAMACPEARLIMVGDGPLLGPTRRLASALGLSDRITFLGAQAHHLVVPRFAQVRGFVQHSLTADDGDSEGTPVAVMEAQMSGLPVVSTRHAGIPEVVAHGETGFLVEEGDTESMGRYLAALLDDAGLAGRLGAAGRVKALREYPIERHIADISTMLLRCMRSDG